MSQVIIPQNIIAPPAETELYVVRGDALNFAVGFVDRPDIAAALPQFRLWLVFRRRQNDASPDILRVPATLEADPPDTFRDRPVSVMGTFAVAPEDTQRLPVSGCVFFMEWTDAADGSNQRIVQGRVNMGD